MRSLVLSTALLASLACGEREPTQTPDAATAPVELRWREWGRAAFDEAREHDKIILINVVAHWCHWCHVMDETTYGDPRIVALLDAHFVTIRVDSDARPDIAERYRKWGWPATAFLTAQAEGVLELRGYRDPARFEAILRELIAERDAGTLARDDHPPELPPPTGANDLAGLQATWLAVVDEFYDHEQGGWGVPKKYPWPGHVELAWLRGEPWSTRAFVTLDRHRQLIDPVWGGMYQYSVGGVWTDPHYEKIAMIQAGAIENFAHAFMLTRDPKWLAAAHDITRYLLDHMQDPQGGFWTSQDADVRTPDALTLGADYYALDDAGRRAIGLPWTDTHVYADLNGLLVEALTELQRASPDPALLAVTIAAAERLIRTHRDPSGGYRHGEASLGPLNLADQVAVGRAFVGLHRVTQDPRWLDHAIEVAEFIERELAAPQGGYFAHQADPEAVGEFAERRMPPEDNGGAARLMLELHGLLDGDGSVTTPWRARAEAALQAAAVPERLALEGKVLARWLLALELARGEAIDVTVVGEPGEPVADALWLAALACWQPRASFERSAPGRRYPAKGAPAVYVCTTTSCSPPLRDAADIAAAITGVSG